jgi:probable F420-dependent oxidoreductase
MKIGIGAPQLGRFADSAVTRDVAVAAEQAGIASLWAIDRLLVPSEPRSPYPGTPDGSLPASQHHVLDPLVTLTVAATVTDRIRLGTDVLVAPWYPPALLARSLATLDRVSAGRLTVGLGVGWSIDEYEAVGAPMRHRGARLEEILETMSMLWRGSTDIETTRERIQSATLAVHPAQRPGPPVLLGTYTPIGLERVARRADGWLPGDLPFEAMTEMWTSVLTTAERYGRDTSAMRLVLRAAPSFHDVALPSDRAPPSRRARRRRAHPRPPVQRQNGSRARRPRHRAGRRPGHADQVVLVRRQRAVGSASEEQ